MGFNGFAFILPFKKIPFSNLEIKKAYYKLQYGLPNQVDFRRIVKWIKNAQAQIQVLQKTNRELIQLNLNVQEKKQKAAKNKRKTIILDQKLIKERKAKKRQKELQKKVAKKLAVMTNHDHPMLLAC